MAPVTSRSHTGPWEDIVPVPLSLGLSLPLLGPLFIASSGGLLVVLSLVPSPSRLWSGLAGERVQPAAFSLPASASPPIASAQSSSSQDCIPPCPGMSLWSRTEQEQSRKVECEAQRGEVACLRKHSLQRKEPALLQGPLANSWGSTPKSSFSAFSSSFSCLVLSDFSWCLRGPRGDEELKGPCLFLLCLEPPGLRGCGILPREPLLPTKLSHPPSLFSGSCLEGAN